MLVFSLSLSPSLSLYLSLPLSSLRSRELETIHGFMTSDSTVYDLSTCKMVPNVDANKLPVTYTLCNTKPCRKDYSVDRTSVHIAQLPFNHSIRGVAQNAIDVHST